MLDTIAVIVIVVLVILVAMAAAAWTHRRRRAVGGGAAPGPPPPTQDEIVRMALPAFDESEFEPVTGTGRAGKLAVTFLTTRPGCRVLVGKGAKGQLTVKFSAPGGLVVVGPSCLLQGVSIKCRLDRGTVAIGNNCALYGTQIISGTGAKGGARPYVAIGERCLMSEETVIRDTDAHPIRAADGTVLNAAERGVVIEPRVWLGGRAAVLKNTRVGAGSVVGFGAVVTRDVPPRSVAAGVPARARPLPDGARWSFG